MISATVNGTQITLKISGSGGDVLNDLTKINIAVLNSMKNAGENAPPIEDFYKLMSKRLSKLAKGEVGAIAFGVAMNALNVGAS